MARSVAGLFGVAAGAALLSCAPEIGPPTWPVVQPRYSYATPEETLESIATALANRSSAAAGYLGAFADSTGPGTPAYHHDFDPADVAAFESGCGCQAPGDWGFSQESAFLTPFLNVRPADRYTAVFETLDEYPDPPPLATEALLARRYRVIATDANEEASVIAIGFAEVRFKKVAGDRWLITRWVDHLDPGIGPNPVDPNQVTLGRRRLDSTR